MEKESSSSFENAFKRLESILEDLSKEKVSLEDSIKLFEEADQLIIECNKRLTTAEKKVETLIKNREGELMLDDDKKPISQEFSSSSQHFLARDET